MKLPAGATLIFQMHYTAKGKAATDRSQIGFVFAKTPPKQEVDHGGAHQPELHAAGRRAQYPRRRADDVQPGRDDLEPAAAHARARSSMGSRRHVSRRPHRDRAGGAAIRLQLADRLHLQGAAEAAEGHDPPLLGVVRQFAGQQVATRIRTPTCTGASRRGKKCSSRRSRSRWIPLRQRQPGPNSRNTAFRGVPGGSL